MTHLHPVKFRSPAGSFSFLSDGCDLIRRASPKSVILSWQSLRTRMLAGLRSRSVVRKHSEASTTTITWLQVYTRCGDLGSGVRFSFLSSDMLFCFITSLKKGTQHKIIPWYPIGKRILRPIAKPHTGDTSKMSPGGEYKTSSPVVRRLVDVVVAQARVRGGLGGTQNCAEQTGRFAMRIVATRPPQGGPLAVAQRSGKLPRAGCCLPTS